eukprot:gb/GECG01007855.1/.p1 GENE.gb/GECG01007855.1/~~gb/GECG01007855.1/.p1  ORF type:complete len:318 (+),score=36.97 gb/GECG01007855.1/:1-954(+)
MTHLVCLFREETECLFVAYFSLLGLLFSQYCPLLHCVRVFICSSWLFHVLVCRYTRNKTSYSSTMSNTTERAKDLPVETDAGIPVVDVNMFLQYEQAEKEGQTPGKDLEQKLNDECKRVAQGLHEYGVLIVKDPRVSSQDNDRFLDTLERYFSQPDDQKQKDVHPEYHYQVGTTPSFTELPKNHCDRMKAFKETDKPLSECPPEKDPKWRFFWRIGERPNSSKHADLNAEAVVPEGFPEWKEVMDTWGNKLLQCVRDVSEMAASGFSLPRKTFSDMMDKAPHLLGKRRVRQDMLAGMAVASCLPLFSPFVQLPRPPT